MLKKIKTFIVVAVASLTLGAPAFVPALASIASADNILTNTCNGISEAANGKNGDCGTAGNNTNTDLSSIASKVVNILSIIVGVVAVVMIIVGGFRYITSGGESSNVSGAKNTLIYAIVGLVIVALAQIIVHYVLNTATSATSNIGT